MESRFSMSGSIREHVKGVETKGTKLLGISVIIQLSDVYDLFSVDSRLVKRFH